jgi:cell division protein FtsA
LVEGIIRPRLNEMVQLIAGEIKKSGLVGLTPSGLVITGGGAQTVGLIESAKRILGSTVRIGIPTDISGLVDEVDNPSFAVSVGLIKYARGMMDDSPGAGSGINLPSLPGMDKIPGKGLAGKLGNWIKSLLP